MGSGASAATDAAKNASADEVTAAVASLSPYLQEKLRKALAEGAASAVTSQFQKGQDTPEEMKKCQEAEKEKKKELEDFKRKYPGKAYQDMKETRFAEILRGERLAIIKSSYFEWCLSAGVRFEDRASIPAQYFIKGDDVMELWAEHGATFLVIFSYAWLTAEHPDPEMYHLKRMVRVLKGLKKYHHEYDDKFDMGVIIDYCSLWQRGRGSEDKRTDAQLKEFKEGLKEINTPYAHKEITAVKLMAVPDDVQRKYDDRGWTLFESIIIDGKAPSSIIEGWGEHNVLTIDIDSDPTDEDTSGIQFVDKLSKGQRCPPCTPERFEMMMEERKKRAVSKGVDLFTSGSDQPFVLEKYRSAFFEQAQTKRYDFSGMGWDSTHMEIFAEVLVHCTDLEELMLNGNKTGDAGAEQLAAALPSLPKLTKLDLSDNKIGDAGAEMLTAALPSLPKLTELYLDGNEIGDAGAEKLTAALPSLPELTILYLSSNKIGEGGAEALAAVLPKLTKLEDLNLCGNNIDEAGRKKILAALPSGCSKDRV